MIAIFIGIGLVSKEIDKRTLYTVLSRPVQRWEFIVGKFFGLAGTLVVNALFMALGVFAALFYVTRHFQATDGWVLVALYFIILQFLIITSLALLFSSFSSPLLSAVFAFALFVIGTFAEDLRGFAGLTQGLVRWLATGAAYLVPNFSALNVISSVAHEQPVASQLILSNTAYALVYASMALCGAVLIFERRNSEMKPSRQITIVASSLLVICLTASVLLLRTIDRERSWSNAPGGTLYLLAHAA